jgi:hypothetical protein
VTPWGIGEFKHMRNGLLCPAGARATVNAAATGIWAPIAI